MLTPQAKKRVGIVAIHHESNTFIPVPTTLELYRKSIFSMARK